MPEFHFYNIYHYGDNILNLKFFCCHKEEILSKEIKIYYYFDNTYNTNIDELLNFAPSEIIELKPLSMKPDHAIELWMGNKIGDVHHYQWDTYFQLHYKKIADILGLSEDCDTSLWQKDDFLLPVYEKLDSKYKNIDILIINGVCNSKQFFHGDLLNQLARDLAKEFNVVTTDKLDDIVCTRDNNLSMLDIGAISMRSKYVIAAFTGPLTTTHNIYSKNYVKHWFFLHMYNPTFTTLTNYTTIYTADFSPIYSYFNTNKNLILAKTHLPFLRCYEFPTDKKIHLGRLADGGYVYGEIGSYDAYISAGVSDEESFTRDFINKYDLKKNQCFAFDGTIMDFPWEFTEEINFIKKNISTHEDIYNTNLHTILSKYKDVLLKMDIESCEYKWVLNLPIELQKNIKQLLIEFHGVNDNSWGVSFEDKIACFKKLAETHYIIHVHANNHSPYDLNGIPHTLELTLVRKTEFPTELPFNKTKLPISGLDFPNLHTHPDLDLSFYPFVA